MIAIFLLVVSEYDFDLWLSACLSENFPTIAPISFNLMNQEYSRKVLSFHSRIEFCASSEE